jgi:putative ABC transport system permease protein
MRTDLFHLSRILRRSPASAVAAILTLSLTLGAAASIFAVVDAVLLTPPPFANPRSLVTAGEVPMDAPAASPRAVTYATFESWRQRGEPLAAIEAFDGTNFTLSRLGAAERVSANDVTPRFLTLLGVAPALGRTFDLDDVGRRVVIVSDAFWRGKLAADPGVIGRQLVLGGQTHTIVGVLPGGFFFALDAGDLWRPLQVTPAQAARTGYRVRVVARLAPAVSPRQLQDALDEVSRQSSPAAQAVVTPIATAVAGGATGTLGLLGGAAGLALFMAFMNLAGLLAARSIDRRRELAVRTALGARQSEIAWQLALEAEALALMGIIGGVLLAWWMTPEVGRLALEQFGGVASRELAVSWRVIGVMAAAAASCAGICGLVPAFLVPRRIVDALHRVATPAPRERVVRRLFVTSQVALALVLLVCMTLVGRSLIRVLRLDPGFEVQDVLTLQVSIPAALYASPERVSSFYNRLQSALEGRLGPGTVSIVDEIPLTGDGGRSLVRVRPTDVAREVVVREAGTAYFNVMRIPIFAGRPFEPHDNALAPPRAVISESLARQLFGFEQPVGRHIRLAPGAQPAEVIGVAGDVRHRALDEAPIPTVYLSALQSPSRSRVVVARSRRPHADVIAIAREEVAGLDPDVPVYGTRSMQEVAARSPGVPARRVLTATFAGLSSLAVVLGTMGLFGLAAHDVARRRTELALRMALGADPMHILSTTLAQSVWVVGSGLVVGGLLSFWAVRALRDVLAAADQVDLAGVALPAIVLMAAAAGAVLPAALRAATTDPVTALRAE